MFQVLRSIALIAALTISGELAFAQNGEISASFVMPSCQEFVGPALRKGQCSGIIEALLYAGKSVGVCPPRASTGQAVAIVMKYIDARPAREQDNFIALSLEALRATWPCKKTP
jgi:hypothetical protein